jgi:hypothetical protein
VPWPVYSEDIVTSQRHNAGAEMGSPSYRLAAAITIPSTDEFLLVRQPPPPSPAPAPEEEEYLYRGYVDSELYDLPSAPLRPLAGELRSDVAIRGADSVAGRLDISRLDVSASLDQICDQFGLPSGICGEWRLLKYVEEAEFGPDAGLNTVLIIGSLESKLEALQDSWRWMSKECASGLLSGAKSGGTRIGPYAYIGLLKPELPSNWTVAPALPCQLAELVNSLPKKLVVLVTHHHHDHVDGLSVVQRCNPDAVLLTHKNTMSRIGKGNWSIGYTAVAGGENICIGDQQLQVVFAPGHTDGHMGVLHVNTNALIVGDHCVG